MRAAVSIAALLLLAGWLAAQAPVKPAPTDKDKPKDTTPKDKPKSDKPKLPPSPLDKVDGYKRQILEGFTVMLSPEAEQGEIKDAKLKPIDALVLEFQTLKKVLPAKLVELLQKVTIWVEWDDYEPLQNGREGKALATYYGGSAQSLFDQKKNPLKSKCITLHSLKSLAEQHQPDRDDAGLVMLHELAHAVHDQLLGFSHPGIQVAYRQALDRKLYDRGQYATTNALEFFAETTCAYFDQLGYYPRTRDDLKKYDPVTYQLQESIWGSGRKVAKAPVVATKPKTLADLDGADKYDTAVKLDAIQLGATIHGPEFKTADGENTVVIISNFGGDELIILERLARMHDELAPYGARVVVAHAFVAEAEIIAKKLAERDVPFTGMDKALFPYKGGAKSEKPAHTLIFDDAGQCIFRGSGYEALPHARAAVARKLITKAIPGEKPKSLAPVLESLTQGQCGLLESLAKFGPLTTSADADTAAGAKALVAAILAPGNALLSEAQSGAKSDPMNAFLIAEKIPAAYKGTSVAAKATALVDQLKMNSVVAKELKARKLFDPIKKLDQALMSQPGSFDTLTDTFQKANRGAIDQLVAMNTQLKKTHPTALCTAEAAKLVTKYSLGE